MPGREISRFTHTRKLNRVVISCRDTFESYPYTHRRHLSVLNCDASQSYLYCGLVTKQIQSTLRGNDVWKAVLQRYCTAYGVKDISIARKQNSIFTETGVKSAGLSKDLYCCAFARMYTHRRQKVLSSLAVAVGEGVRVEGSDDEVVDAQLLKSAYLRALVPGKLSLAHSQFQINFRVPSRRC